MKALELHNFHRLAGASFCEVNGEEAVADYGDAMAEHAAVKGSAGLFDLSFRGRLVLTGTDRVRFLHGQVTNDVKRLRTGEGCYSALTTAKGKLQSDLNIYCLADELLLDFEPGLTAAVSARLEKYIVADDVQLVDAAPHYGLLSVQGPQADAVLRSTGLTKDLPEKAMQFRKIENEISGELYLMNQPRLATRGFDIYAPTASLATLADRILAALKTAGGLLCGWQTFEIARIEAGLPRFGADMDETNFPQECGIDERAVSYTKGCYIGQEVLNRIHTMGHVNRALCGLKLGNDLAALPLKGDKLFHSEKEVGLVTSATWSPAINGNIALAVVRQGANSVGTELTLRSVQGQSMARVEKLPFA